MKTPPYNIIVVVLFAAALFACSASTQAQPASPPSAGGMDDAMNTLLEFSTTAADQQAEPIETNRVKLLHKQASELRDPFWPVGYTPPRKEASKQPAVATPAAAPEPVVTERPARWDDALRTVSVKGIMSVGEGKYMAVVNDKVVNENDTVSVFFEGRQYTWKVARIAADGVKFQKLTVTK